MSTEPPPAWPAGTRDGISLAAHDCPRAGSRYVCQASQITAREPWPPLCGCYDREAAALAVPVP